MGEVVHLGFSMTEYSEFMALRAMYETYIDAILNLRPVPFTKVMDDTLQKWSFIDKWAERQTSRSGSSLIKLPEKDKILELALLDEALCVDGLVSSLGKDRCSVCPLWHINGYSCEDHASIKSMVISPLYTGLGYFSPYRLLTILLKIKLGQPIYRADIMPLFM